MLSWFEMQAPIREKFRVLVIALTLAVSINLADIPLLIFAPEHALAAVTATALLSLGAVIAILLMTSERICRPYVETVLRMEALADGDTKSPIAYTRHSDCVGRMTKAMERFRATIEQTTDLETQQRVVEQMNRALSRLADNDLTATITNPFPDAYESLRVNYNQGVTSIAGTMADISTMAAHVLSGGEEINAASADLAQRNERQAANLQRAANAMNEVTSALSETASQAGEANRSVATAAARAVEGQDIAASATSSMQEIERSSQEISRIVSLIDGIAFQTNLLALNAGVEAARAGEAGRGFAVVATEVRALAQRCADAARDIKTLVTASSETVSQGVSTVERTRQVLAELATRITEIDSFIGEVAAKTGEQVAQLKDVNANVAEMDLMTQQNAAMVEQSAAAARSLAQQANTLSSSVGAFRIADGNSTVDRIAPRAAPAPVHTPAPAPVYSPRPAPLRKQGNLAVAALDSAQDWTEF